MQSVKYVLSLHPVAVGVNQHRLSPLTFVMYCHDVIDIALCAAEQLVGVYIELESAFVVQLADGLFVPVALGIEMYIQLEV